MVIKLSRELTGNERIDVNYRISGAIADVHYRDKLFRRENVTSITRMKRADGSRRVRFTAGAQIATIRLAALNNNDRADRILTIRLGGGHQRVVARHISGDIKIAQSEVTVSILDDDKPQQVLPEVTIAGRLPLSEGKPARFLVTATPAPALPLNVLVHFVPDGDFGVDKHDRWVTIPRSGTANVGVGTVDDSVDEPNGSVTASVFLRDGYSVGTPSSATVKVRDNDLAPAPAPALPVVTMTGTAQIAGKFYTLNHAWPTPKIIEGGSIAVTVHVTPAPTSPMTVAVGIGQRDGVSDFGVSSETRQIRVPTSGEATFTVTTDDDDVEDSRSDFVRVWLQNSSSYVIATPWSVQVQVLDDDGKHANAVATNVDADTTSTAGNGSTGQLPVVNVGTIYPSWIKNNTITENRYHPQNTFRFRITANPAPVDSLDVNIQLLRLGDYRENWWSYAFSPQIRISSSGSSGFIIGIVADDEDEPDGFLAMRILPGEGYVVGDSSYVKITILDDD